MRSSKVRNVTFATLVVALWAGAADAGQVAKGNNYVINATSSSCHVGGQCTVALRLEAQGSFHVNKEYPYKFMANDTSGVEFLGKDPANKKRFTKSAGDFALDAGNEKVGTMTVRFKPSSRGSKNISGLFKFSVCSQQNCQLGQANITVAVNVH
jgi:hypothetical protein